MIEIKKATRDDWVDVIDLYAQCNHEIDERFGGGVNMALLSDGLEYAFQNDDAVYIAWGDDKPVGVVAWTHTPLCREGQCVGFGTYVKPEYRRQGVAAMLRDCASDHLRRKGYKTIQGVAAVTNVAGLASAIQDGFVITAYLVEKKL